MKKEAILYIAVLTVLAGIISCEKNLEKSNKLESADTLPRIVVNDTKILYSDSLKVQMQLQAPEIIEHTELDTPYTEFTKGVDVDFYDDSLNVQSGLNADYAIYHRSKNLWEYKGNVRLVNEQGDRLETEHLYADREARKIYSTELVKIISPDGTEVQGAGGFESNLRFTEYQFKDVSGKINQ